METFEIDGREYPVIGYTASKAAGGVPLVDIPMMSDYKWQLDCLNDRLEHPEKYTRYGEDVAATIAQLRWWLKEHSEEATA